MHLSKSLEFGSQIWTFYFLISVEGAGTLRDSHTRREPVHVERKTHTCKDWGKSKVDPWLEAGLSTN